MSISRPLGPLSALLATTLAFAAPPEPVKPLPSHGTSPQASAAGGIRWTAPKTWPEQPARMMRVATYSVPAAPGAEGGECAVFFFVKGQGGSIDENVHRWAGQFEAAPAPVRGTKSIQALTVHTVAVSGTFLAPSGPMMQSSGRKPGWKLLGAIVEAPEGRVFFKLTGPASTVDKAGPGFDALVASLRKGA